MQLKIMSHVFVIEQTEKMYWKGDFEYTKSLDESGIWRYSGSLGEDYNSAVRPYKDQFSNFEAALLGQGSDRIPNYSDAYRRPPQPMAWKQRYHGQDSTIFGGAIHGA